MAFRVVVLLWAFFELSASVRCERGDNCTCRGEFDSPECPCLIEIYPILHINRTRRKLNCEGRDLEGNPLFIDFTELDVTVEELHFL